MKKSFLVVLMFAKAAFAQAQVGNGLIFDDVFPDLPVMAAAPLRLTPCSASGINVVDSYSANVDEMFGLKNRLVQWAYMDCPSFSPEHAVKCIVISGQPYLVAVTASKNIWYNQPKNVEIISDTLQVSREQAGQLDALFRLAVETSSFMPYPRAVFTDENGNKTLKGGFPDVAILDGNSYTFFSECRAAMCRNQFSDNPIKALVDIGTDLYGAVKAKDMEAVNKILERVESTKQSLLVAAPDWYAEYLEAMTNDLWK